MLLRPQVQGPFMRGRGEEGKIVSGKIIFLVKASLGDLSVASIAIGAPSR